MTTTGQLVMVGVEGTKVGSEHRLFFKETGIGGVIIFGRNYRKPQQLADFIKGLQDASETPLMIAVDQEGGRVARLKAPFTELPPMSALGRSGERGVELAREVGALLGRELSAIGIHIDFAPVLDVGTNPFNPVIGDRAMAGNAEDVARLGCAFVSGMQSQGVAACGKHFPGHGDTDVDSHLGLPLLAHTRRRFDECELIPFRAAAAAGVATMMTAHMLIPNLDAEAPASISRRITTGMLRSELGFNGLIFTDDLIMQGIAGSCTMQEAAWRSIDAGADVVLVCHNREKQREALEGLRRAVGEGRIGMTFISDALARIAAFKERFVTRATEPPPLSVIGCKAHQKFAEELRTAL